MENKNVDSVKKTTKESTKKTTNKRSKDLESRKKVFLVLIAIILVLAIVLILVPVLKKNGNIMASNKLSEEKSFETYKLKETKISYEEDTTVFETKIENIGSETIPAGGFNIILLDKEGVELTSIGVYLKEMEPAETIETKAVIGEKIENIYDIKIVSEENIITDEEQVPEETPVE